MLACEPQAADIRPEILMHFQAGAGGPVAVAAECPRGGAPPRVHEGGGLRDVFRAVHVAQDGEDLGFRGCVVLVLRGIGLLGDNCDEEDPGAGEEARTVEGLEDGIIATFYGVGVEEELGGGVPEYLVLGELEENLSVGGWNASTELLTSGRLEDSPIENVSIPSCFQVGS